MIRIYDSVIYCIDLFILKIFETILNWTKNIKFLEIGCPHCSFGCRDDKIIHTYTYVQSDARPIFMVKLRKYYLKFRFLEFLNTLEN